MGQGVGFEQAKLPVAPCFAHQRRGGWRGWAGRRRRRLQSRKMAEAGRPLNVYGWVRGKPALTTAFGCATSSQGAALHSPARARAAEVGWEAWAGGTEAWEETAHMARLLGRLHIDGSSLGWLHANQQMKRATSLARL